jgi:predicted DNA-binding transcriptional regulator AlpA
MPTAQANNRKLPTRQVCARYGVTDRTIARWMRDPDLNFPQPTVINGRNYFDDESLTMFDRAQAAQCRT